MATNASSITHNKTNGEDWMYLPASHCIPWLVVFSIECLVIVILNAITVIVFVKQSQLQRKSTYLIIHLAIVDFFVGAVSGPLGIEDVGSRYCDLWEYVGLDFWLAMLKHGIGANFSQISFLNLAFISLERAHATFRPFKHRFVKRWVYGVMITFTWLVHVVIGLLNGPGIVYVFFSYFFILLFIILVCYVSISIKVRCGRPPQHHGAAGLRDRKLTSTVFLVTFGSLLTFLPMVVFWGVVAFDLKFFSLPLNFSFHVSMVCYTFYVLNSLINPIIYAIRMPELRAGILQIIFRRAPRRSNRVNIPLQDP